MRSGIAVLGGALIFAVLYNLLQATVAGRSPSWLGPAQFAIVPVAALLAGYMTAKLAAAREVLHGAVTALLIGALLVNNFIAGDAPPRSIALRGILVVVAVAAVMTAAYVRGQARILGSQT